MTPRTSSRTIVVVLLALFALLASASVGAQPSTPPAGHEAHHAGTPIPTQSMSRATMMPGSPRMGGMMQVGEFDLMFIDMMIQHHEGAVAMSQVALERAEHPEITQLAQTIIDDQKAEIDQLRAWRDAWYPGAAELSIDDMMSGMGQMMAGMPGMQGMVPMMGMMDPETAAAALQGADPFDLAFLDAMIPHHLGALMMSEMAVQQATHPELATMAQTMFDTQTAEIAQMRAWRADWSGAAATPAS